MGVPVVTLRGTCHASRVSSSILQAIGRPEWVADTDSEYVSIVANLAEDIEKLEMYRTNQRRVINESKLCDGLSFVAGLESMYETIWQKRAV